MRSCVGLCTLLMGSDVNLGLGLAFGGRDLGLAGQVLALALADAVKLR